MPVINVLNSEQKKLPLMSVQIFVEEIKKGRTDFRSLQIHSSSIYRSFADDLEYNLKGLDFSGSIICLNLNGFTCKDCSFAGAIFPAKYHKENMLFIHCDCNALNASYCSFKGSTFDKSTALNDANLSGAFLQKTSFDGCSMKKVNLSYANVSITSSFLGANLEGADVRFITPRIPIFFQGENLVTMKYRTL